MNKETKMDKCERCDTPISFGKRCAPCDRAVKKAGRAMIEEALGPELLAKARIVDSPGPGPLSLRDVSQQETERREWMALARKGILSDLQKKGVSAAELERLRGLSDQEFLAEIDPHGDE